MSSLPSTRPIRTTELRLSPPVRPPLARSVPASAQAPTRAPAPRLRLSASRRCATPTTSASPLSCLSPPTHHSPRSRPPAVALQSRTPLVRTTCRGSCGGSARALSAMRMSSRGLDRRPPLLSTPRATGIMPLLWHPEWLSVTFLSNPTVLLVPLPTLAGCRPPAAARTRTRNGAPSRSSPACAGPSLKFQTTPNAYAHHSVCVHFRLCPRSSAFLLIPHTNTPTRHTVNRLWYLSLLCPSCSIFITVKP
jgi:hypothetical protein